MMQNESIERDFGKDTEFPGCLSSALVTSLQIESDPKSSDGDHQASRYGFAPGKLSDVVLTPEVYLNRTEAIRRVQNCTKVCNEAERQTKLMFRCSSLCLTQLTVTEAYLRLRICSSCQLPDTADCMRHSPDLQGFSSLSFSSGKYELGGLSVPGSVIALSQFPKQLQTVCVSNRERTPETIAMYLAPYALHCANTYMMISAECVHHSTYELSFLRELQKHGVWDDNRQWKSSFRVLTDTNVGKTICIQKHHCFLRQLDFVQKLWSDQYHPPSLTAGGGKGLRVLREEASIHIEVQTTFCPDKPSRARAGEDRSDPSCSLFYHSHFSTLLEGLFILTVQNLGNEAEPQKDVFVQLFHIKRSAKSRRHVAEQKPTTGNAKHQKMVKLTCKYRTVLNNTEKKGAKQGTESNGCRKARKQKCSHQKQNSVVETHFRHQLLWLLLTWVICHSPRPGCKARAADRVDKQSLLSPKKTGAVLQLNEPLDLLPVTGRLTALERDSIQACQWQCCSQDTSSAEWLCPRGCSSSGGDFHRPAELYLETDTGVMFPRASHAVSSECVVMMDMHTCALAEWRSAIIHECVETTYSPVAADASNMRSPPTLLSPHAIHHWKLDLLKSQYGQENPFIQSLKVYLQSTTPQAPRNPPALNNIKPKWTRSHVSHRLALSRKLVKRLQRFLANNVPRISTAQEEACIVRIHIVQSQPSNTSHSGSASSFPDINTLKQPHIAPELRPADADSLRPAWGDIRGEILIPCPSSTNNEPVHSNASLGCSCCTERNGLSGCISKNVASTEDAVNGGMHQLVTEHLVQPGEEQNSENLGEITLLSKLHYDLTNKLDISPNNISSSLTCFQELREMETVCHSEIPTKVWNASEKTTWGAEQLSSYQVPYDQPEVPSHRQRIAKEGTLRDAGPAQPQRSRSSCVFQGRFSNLTCCKGLDVLQDKYSGAESQMAKWIEGQRDSFPFIQVKYGIQSEQVHYWVHMGLGNPYLPIPNHLVPPCTAYGKSFSCLILLHPSCDSVTVLQCSCPARAAPPSRNPAGIKDLGDSGKRWATQRQKLEQGVPVLLPLAAVPAVRGCSSHSHQRPMKPDCPTPQLQQPGSAQTDAQQNNDAFELSYSEEEMVIDTRSELRDRTTCEPAAQCTSAHPTLPPLCSVLEPELQQLQGPATRTKAEQSQNSGEAFCHRSVDSYSAVTSSPLGSPREQGLQALWEKAAELCQLHRSAEQALFSSEQTRSDRKPGHVGAAKAEEAISCGAEAQLACVSTRPAERGEVHWLTALRARERKAIVLHTHGPLGFVVRGLTVTTRWKA
ncbi:hypothetical protein Anapl_09165 [Anas platyrhynchos]|uniref:Uncharacterized protein n=1 Tax=Anas platyrhynchos TaxID=8839 RepID=R0LGL0_ANAPL|nr:hypothetical protein Anapl_09165 [Anas platyrhynchos]